MTMTVDHAAVLDFLLSMYSEHPGTYRAVPGDHVESARCLLRTLVTNAEILDEYVLRVDRVLKGVVPPPDLVYEAACLNVVQLGIAELTPATLGQILLDPIAVINVHMAVDRTTPDCWRKDLHENGTKLMDQYGVAPYTPSSSGERVSQHT